MPLDKPPSLTPSPFKLDLPPPALDNRLPRNLVSSISPIFVHTDALPLTAPLPHPLLQEPLHLPHPLHPRSLELLREFSHGISHVSIHIANSSSFHSSVPLLLVRPPPLEVSLRPSERTSFLKLSRDISKLTFFRSLQWCLFGCLASFLRRRRSRFQHPRFRSFDPQVRRCARCRWRSRRSFRLNALLSFPLFIASPHSRHYPLLDGALPHFLSLL